MYSLKNIRFYFGGLEEMMNRWWCMDCRSAVELDTHGRCASCESEAVDSFHPGIGDTSTAPIADMPVIDSISCS